MRHCIGLLIATSTAVWIIHRPPPVCSPVVPPAGRHRRKGHESAAFLLISPKPSLGLLEPRPCPKPSLQQICPQYSGSSKQSYKERSGSENPGRSCQFPEEAPLSAQGKCVAAALLGRTTEHLSRGHVSPLLTRFLLLFKKKIPL